MNTTPNEVAATGHTASAITLTSKRGRRSIVIPIGNGDSLLSHERFDADHGGWFYSHCETAYGKQAARRAVTLWLGVEITPALLA